ncbi:hypothetical protein VB712_16595 [Spirulina sp. CCNP1310]|uniref:hypothetical protein n=1 Tax=Spirulina sp. CCNP1310 TaxID=3110249 RepID=UPI002B21023B|nr:hypothetical protein [Spirulina sp. CCNP1310]MEA5420850.1 hypothetical protein [Spirulina sp. CCNP1310]
MKKVLSEYCCGELKSGLLLLSMPTGFGKTHSVLNFIYEHYEEFAAQNRKILFITNLKKNLPIQDLKERFIANQKEEEFDQHVLFIDSNLDAIKQNLLSVSSEIPEQFKNPTYSKLQSYIQTLSNPKNKLPKEVQLSLKSEIRKQIEPEFRKSITDSLDKFKTKKERLSAIKDDPHYQWIGKLYPAVFTDERTVLFLSMDKFFLKNTTLIERSYHLHVCDRLIKNSLIFIDEFDTTKDTVLKNIIDSGLQHRIDLLNLFLSIHNHLVQSECPQGLIKESMWRKNAQTTSKKNWPSLPQIIDELREKATAIFSRYNLQHTCKSHEDFSTKKRNFLFYDYQFHSVLDAHHKSIRIIADLENCSNWITAVEPKSQKVGVDIRSLLNEISGFLSYFQRGIGYLAHNYCHLKQENELIRETFPLELAIRTVLNHFRLDSENVAFLTKNIMEGNMPYGIGSEKSTLERQSFYDNGFRYYDIVDSNEHDTLSKIYMYNFNQTPESFLVNVCSKAMVVGISATAGLYTNIGNYDLEYLKAQLDSTFVRLTGKTLDRLKDAYNQSIEGYDSISINTVFCKIDCHQQAIDELEHLLDDQEAAQALWNKLQYTNLEKSRIENVFCRYVRTLTAWKYFLEHRDCHAFLSLFNKFPKCGDSLFDLNVFHEYASLLVEKTSDVANEDITDIVVVLSSEQFEENKEKLTHELAQGKRRFIISTYQTIGSGQNIQYPIPQSLNPIHINKFPKRIEMDINGIYLDRPTNLLVNIYDNDIDNQSFIKYIFQLEFFVENGAISPRIFKNKLNEAFFRYVGRQRYNRSAEDYSNLYQTDAYARFVNKIIIQAVGRICRTNMKAQTIHILADASIQKHLARVSLPEDVITVHEYDTLLESAGKYTEQADQWIEAQNRASSRSNRTTAYIQRQLKTPWTPETVAEWQALREQVLRQPAVSETDSYNTNWGNIYVELPESSCSYRYSEQNDYRDIEIFFSEEYGEKEVSERSARLAELMEIKILRDLFTKSGWATSFPKSKHILTPPMFNNIYKGVLGEVSGKHIFEYFLNIKLSELSVEEFECFDFKTDQGSYVDFKLWNDHVAVDAEKSLKKIHEKMERINASRVFIVNILGTQNTNFFPVISNERVIEIPYLCQNGNIDNNVITFLLKEFCT